ncbi:MAG: CCA tRNA nucleotidyltransferase [Candidatus Micrarchaeota archaeon]
MGKVEELLEEVRKKVRPGEKEIGEIEKAKNIVIERLENVLPKDVQIGLMGSVAKGTALKDNKELDIFLLFDKKYRPEEVKEKGLAWAKKAMKGIKTRVNYAQHPYLQVLMKEVKVDIVPSFKLENNEKLKTAVDRSQLHKKWVNRRVDEKMCDDVRLLKQFMKNIGVYGAQLRVEGFSGYLCELLIIKYGSFLGVLKAASKWQEPAIDIANYHGEEKARGMFPKAAMVVIDPTDKERNVAAVVSHTSLSRFILASRQFLKNPAKEHFFREKEVHSAGKLRKMIKGRGTHAIVLVMPAPKLVEDVLWPQLRKTAHSLLWVLKNGDFHVFGHYFYADKKRAIIIIETKEKELPAIKHVPGPFVWHPEHVDAFVEKHKNAINLHAEHDRVVAIEKRKCRTPREALEEAFKNMERTGVPKPFANALKKREWENAYYLLGEEKLREIASDYFSRKL